MRILAINRGTSSLKYLLAAVEGSEVRVQVRGQANSVAEILDVTGREGIEAAGHRIVHGGAQSTGAVLIDDDTLAQLDGLADLAPLHNPPSVAIIRELLTALPGVQEYAVFDTAFHATLPAAAATYAVPLSWRRDYAIRRYGFHGLAHRWMAERAAACLGRPLEGLRLVTLQLGSGASACAISGGQSVDTSMGMSPAEGLVMATRSGDVDPLITQYLARMGAGTPDELWTALERESGLLGLTGDQDLKAVVERAGRGDADAGLALEICCHRIRKYVSAYLGVLGGADAIIFGGGVGEHSHVIRERSLAGMEWVGVQLDPAANAAPTAPDAVISSHDSRIAVIVCQVDEETLICRDVAGAIAG